MHGTLKFKTCCPILFFVISFCSFGFQGDSTPDVEPLTFKHGPQSVVVVYQGLSQSAFQTQVKSLLQQEKLNLVSPELLEDFPIAELSDPSTSDLVMTAYKDAAREAVAHLCLVKGTPQKPEAWLYSLSSGGVLWRKELKQYKKPTPTSNGGFYETQVFALATSLFESAQKLDPGSAVMVPAVSGDNSERAIQRALEKAILDHSNYMLVNREEMDTLGKEQLFNESPFVDPEKAVQMGRLVGARFMFVAKAQANFSLPGWVYLKVRLRVIDVQTSRQMAEEVASKFAMHGIWWIGLAVVVLLILLKLLRSGVKSKAEEKQRKQDRATQASHQKHIETIELEANKWPSVIAAFRKEVRQKQGPDEAMKFLEVEKKIGLLIDRLHKLPRGPEGVITDASLHLKQLRRVEDAVAEMSLYILNRDGSPRTYCERVIQQIHSLESVLNEIK
ncbi:MAG: hypothetical protein CR997_04135 [Acidobacteria bacterium]|nr:MAG: hypothetical protein CR997_04135 [Acidobacteriota bacterium]